MKRESDFQGKTAAGIFLWCLAAALAVYSLFLCFSKDIWYDELFTEGFIGQTVGNLIRLDAQDVHPPLYYLLVKAVADCTGLLWPAADRVVVGKLMSVVPFLGLLGYAAVLVRRRYGWLCAGTFAFCLIGMPQMANYTTEVRMYGWALFFLTAAYLHGGEILYGGSKGRLHWTAFILFGICAAYTHYFAAVAAFFLYLILGGGILLEKGEGRRRKAMLWAAGAGLSAAAYLPWLPSAAAQVSAVRKDYWILPLEWSCFGGCVKFVLKPSTGYVWLDYGAAVLLFFLLAGFMGSALLRHRETDGVEQKKLLYASCGPLLVGATALFGILVSVLMRPVFIYRYMLPALGCFWFAFACLLSRQKNRIVRAACLILLFMVGISDYRAFAREESFKKAQMERTTACLDAIGEDAAVLFNFDQVQAVAGYYIKQDTWLYEDEPEELIRRMFPQAHGGADVEWLKERLERGVPVWFVGSGLAREGLLEEWEREGIIAAETVDSCLLERYWFNLYRLEKKTNAACAAE